MLEMDEVRDAGRQLGLDVVTLEVQRTEDIAPALDSVKGKADALYVVTDPLLNTNRDSINTMANAERLPTMHGEKAYVEAGGLMSYGPNFPDLFRRAAEQVDKILRGAKPGDIPVEQPIKFDLAINLTTAKALGVTVPPSLLAQADDVFYLVGPERTNNRERGPSELDSARPVAERRLQSVCGMRGQNSIVESRLHLQFSFFSRLQVVESANPRELLKWIIRGSARHSRTPIWWAKARLAR